MTLTISTISFIDNSITTNIRFFPQTTLELRHDIRRPLNNFGAFSGSDVQTAFEENAKCALWLNVCMMTHIILTIFLSQKPLKFVIADYLRFSMT